MYYYMLLVVIILLIKIHSTGTKRLRTVGKASLMKVLRVKNTSSVLFSLKLCMFHCATARPVCAWIS